MNKKIIIIIAAITLFSSCFLQAKIKYGVGANFDKSLTILRTELAENTVSRDVISDIVGFGINGNVYIRKYHYLRIEVAHTSYTYKENFKMYEASSTDLKVHYVYYFSKVDEFTAMASMGGGLSFVTNSGVVEDFDNGLNLAETMPVIGPAFRANIPLFEGFVFEPGFSVDYYLDENIGLVPKIDVGVTYWID